MIELEENRESWVDAARAFPRAWKLLVATGGVLATVATTSAGVAVTYAAKIAAYATDVEVDAKVAKATQDAIDREGRIGRSADAAAAMLRMQAELDARNKRTIELALMRRLVSMEAADREQRRTHKADASRIARNALATLCLDYKVTGECKGESLEKASDLALDARQ